MRGILHQEDFGWSNAPRFGGGGGTTTSSTTQNTTPWSEQQPYLLQGFQEADKLFNNSPWPQYYGGNTYVPLNSSQNGAINSLFGTGMQGGTSSLQEAQSNAANTLAPSYTNGTQPQFNQGQGVLSNEMSSGYLNPWNSPSFNTVVGNTIASVLPSVTSSYLGGNRLDSGLATRAASQGLTDAVGSLAQNQYNTNQQIQQNAVAQAGNNYLTQQGNQMKALSLAPMIDQQAVSDLNTAFNAAGQDQQNQQNLVNADIQRWNYNQSLPFNMLGQFQNSVAGNYGGMSTGTQTQPYYSNTGANIMSGVLGVGGIAAAFL